MSIIYEVTLKVDPSIQEDFLSWLKNHVREMLEFPGFEEAHLFHTQMFEPQSGFIVQYRIQNQGRLDEYFAKFAPNMRAQGKEKFGDQFEATRRVYSDLMEFTPQSTGA